MKNNVLAIVKTVLILFTTLAVGIFIGGTEINFFKEVEEKIEQIEEKKEEKKEYEPLLEHERAVISVVESNIPAVVSIVATKYVEYIDYSVSDFFLLVPEVRERLQEEQGTGFIIQEDGVILTNKHVVADENAKYTVFLSTGEKFDADVLARDPIQDLAVLKIDGENLPIVTIGDSDTVRAGQTAIAIGNALGEFQNTVSAGIISGIGRRIIARGGHTAEVMDDVLQTDAAINFGNSGGPLLNLKGEVIGINTATMISAEGIGFAIPVNKAKRAIQGAVKEGKIVYPFLGVRYIIIDKKIKEEENLKVDYGAFVVSGAGREVAVTPNSAAEKAGIKEGDIILEINKEKITLENTLAQIITKYNPQDKIELKILRGEIEMIIEVILGEIS
jgi:S1-C subfamily serine protease